MTTGRPVSTKSAESAQKVLHWWGPLRKSWARKRTRLDWSHLSKVGTSKHDSVHTCTIIPPTFHAKFKVIKLIGVGINMGVAMVDKAYICCSTHCMPHIILKSHSKKSWYPLRITLEKDFWIYLLSPDINCKDMASYSSHSSAAPYPRTWKIKIFFLVCCK